MRHVLGGWAPYLAFVAASLSALHLVGVLGLGAMWVTTDWSALECFDGTEPACSEPSEAGLSEVRASSWVLASVATMAVFGALVLAFRLRRAVQLAPVLALCATSAVLAQVLWLRL